MTRSSLTMLVSALLAVTAAPRIAAQERPALTPADYGRWESLGSATLSPDGKWLAYRITRVNDESELRLRWLERDSTRVMPWGTGAKFSADSRWLAWSIDVPPEERKRLEQEKKPVRLGAGVLHLADGAEQTFENVSGVAFDATGKYLVLEGYAPDEPEGKGADIRVVVLANGVEMNFGNVAEYAWSEAGSLLALALATGTDAGNGIQVYDAATGRILSLDASASAYGQLAWREDGFDLAALRSTEPASEDGSAYRLLAWRGVNASPQRFAFDPAAAGIADTLEVVRHRRPEWSDGGRIAFGLRPVTHDEGADTSSAPSDSATAEPEADEDDEELPGVQIWHSTDVRPIPMQQTSVERNARRTLLAVWNPDRGSAVQVGTGLLENATLMEGWRFGLEDVSEPYPWGFMFGRPYHDVWAVDLESGRRARLLERVRYSWESGAGHYVLWFDGKDYWSHDLRSGRQANLTRELPAVFADTAYDTPTDLLPPHGVGGWLDDDAAVFLYDHYDVWRVAPDGSGGERLTSGSSDRIVHRISRLDTESPTIDPDEPIYLSLWGEWSERRGYARIVPGRAPERLVFLDQWVSGLQKADSAEVFLYSAQAFDDSPDLFVAGPRLRSPTQVTATNPFQGDYAWGRAELVEYTSEAGHRLQGALLYPANHDPSHRYPMIVYTYEILSSRIHLYQVPSERSYYNFTAWTQEGYFVLLPDIVYRARDPGVSAIEAVRPAVATVVAMGLVDPNRVGLIGHSWGGYQAAYLPTRIDIFAASVAGAPLTDFVSFMGAFHWNQGFPETGHWETGQGRMEVPYWEDPDAHHRNSPIHKVQDLKTPLLMACGDDDGVVDWDQCTEFYNFARRAGKQMVLLVYEGEDHGFAKKPNQIDYHRRILEWFGHYLKGEDAPRWITDGVSLDEHEAEARRVARPGDRP